MAHWNSLRHTSLLRSLRLCNQTLPTQERFQKTQEPSSSRTNKDNHSINRSIMHSSLVSSIIWKEGHVQTYLMQHISVRASLRTLVGAMARRFATSDATSLPQEIKVSCSDLINQKVWRSMWTPTLRATGTLLMRLIKTQHNPVMGTSYPMIVIPCCGNHRFRQKYVSVQQKVRILVCRTHYAKQFQLCACCSNYMNMAFPLSINSLESGALSLTLLQQSSISRKHVTWQPSCITSSNMLKMCNPHLPYFLQKSTSGYPHKTFAKSKIW